MHNKDIGARRMLDGSIIGNTNIKYVRLIVLN